MNKIFLSALVLLTLFSCKEDKPDEQSGNGQGRIMLSASINREVDNISTRADGYTYKIQLDGPTVENFELNTTDHIISVIPGQYTIVATTPVDYTLPNMNTPVYQDIATVTVPANGSEKATLKCCQINTGIRFVFDKSVEDYYSNLIARIEDNSAPENFLEFGYTNQANGDIAHFDPSQLKITLSAGGNPVNIGAKESLIIDTKAKELWTITFKTSQTLPGQIVMTVEIDKSTEAEEDELGIGEVIGDGTFYSPYLANAAINVMPAQNIWIEGIIVGQSTVTAKTRTGLEALLIGSKTGALENECIVIDLAESNISKKITDLIADPSAIGKTVRLKGDIASSSPQFETSARAVLANITDFDYEGQEKGIDGTNAITLSGKTLKELSKGMYFKMGATIKTDHFVKFSSTEKNYYDLIERDFNSFTLEYEMKMSLQVKLNNKLSQYDYRIKNLEDFNSYVTNSQNGMSVHGHALVWYKDIPGLIDKDKSDDPESDILWHKLPADELKQKLEEYIEFTMLKYPYVRSWDVVNEAINNTNGGYWDCPWLDAYGSGEDYVREVFKIARRVADENNLPCKLFYNDYKTEYYPTKRRAITDMIKKLNGEYAAANGGKTLIDGIGLQMHLSIGEADKYDLEAAIDAAVETGCLVHISELSVALSSSEDDMPAIVTNDMLRKQNQLINKVFDLALTKVPADKLWGITFWGLTDEYSGYQKRQAMLFDKDFNAKRSYFELIDKYAQ